MMQSLSLPFLPLFALSLAPSSCLWPYRSSITCSCTTAFGGACSPNGATALPCAEGPQPPELDSKMSRLKGSLSERLRFMSCENRSFLPALPCSTGGGTGTGATGGVQFVLPSTTSTLHTPLSE